LGAAFLKQQVAGLVVGLRASIGQATPGWTSRVVATLHQNSDKRKDDRVGFFDKFKKKAAEVADDHGDKIEAGIDKAADVADDKTDGKYSDKIESGAEAAKDFVEKLDTDD